MGSAELGTPVSKGHPKTPKHKAYVPKLPPFFAPRCDDPSTRMRDHCKCLCENPRTTLEEGAAFMAAPTGQFFQSLTSSGPHNAHAESVTPRDRHGMCGSKAKHLSHSQPGVSDCRVLIIAVVLNQS